MKKVALICVVLLCFLFTGCMNQSDGKKTDQKNETTTVDVISDYVQITVPADWTSMGDSYYKNGRIQLFIDTFDFDVEKLKKEFSYADDKECIRNFFYNGSEADDGITYKKQSLIFPSYQFKMTADKYFKDKNGIAVDNQDPMIVQAMIDSKHKTLYMLYFTDEMADEKKVDDFLSNITRFDETHFYDEEFGLYRWQGGAEIYGK